MRSLRSMSFPTTSRWFVLLLATACDTSPPVQPTAAASTATSAQASAIPASQAVEAATCNHDHAAASAPAAAAPAPRAEDISASAQSRNLIKVSDPSQICMVRNHVMGRPQLSVEVAGATYFGCCAGCIGRLHDAPEARSAVDPITHRTIDKAVAVIAQNERGNVLYFENDNSLAAYQSGFGLD